MLLLTNERMDTTSIDFLDLKAVNGQYDAELEQALLDVLHSGWYLKGKATAAFEEEYARYIGTNYCVGVGNGLDALTLIFRAYMEMGLMSQGDEVIVPANTYIASILSVTENGLRPVLVEPRIDTLEIDDALIEAAITPSTRAVMIVHLYGRCAFTERVGDICRRHGLMLVEDNAQAHGCAYRLSNSSPSTLNSSLENTAVADSSLFTLHSSLKRSGSLGHAAGHSFYPGKNLGALGDAGAVTTDDPELARCVRSLANYGSQRKYVFEYQGRNSRLDELQAAVLRVKLRHLDDDNRKRQAMAAYYYEHIDNEEIMLPERLPDENNVYHLFPVMCNWREQLQDYLAGKGIQTLIHYPIPPHRQQCYAREWPGLSLPVTERIHNTELSLPISPVMEKDHVRYVTETVNGFHHRG